MSITLLTNTTKSCIGDDVTRRCLPSSLIASIDVPRRRFSSHDCWIRIDCEIKSEMMPPDYTHPTVVSLATAPSCLLRFDRTSSILTTMPPVISCCVWRKRVVFSSLLKTHIFLLYRPCYKNTQQNSNTHFPGRVFCYRVRGIEHF